MGPSTQFYRVSPAPHLGCWQGWNLYMSTHGEKIAAAKEPSLFIPGKKIDGTAFGGAPILLSSLTASEEKTRSGSPIHQNLFHGVDTLQGGAYSIPSCSHPVKRGGGITSGEIQLRLPPRRRGWFQATARARRGEWWPRAERITVAQLPFHSLRGERPGP